VIAGKGVWHLKLAVGVRRALPYRSHNSHRSYTLSVPGVARHANERASPENRQLLNGELQTANSEP
jgi:hypothetical protein